MNLFNSLIMTAVIIALNLAWVAGTIWFVVTVAKWAWGA